MNRMRPLKYLAFPLIVLLCGCGKFFTDDTGGGGGGTSTSNYLYVANSTGSSLGAFSVSTAGALTALNGGATYSVPAAPSALAANASGTLLYVGSQNGAIYLYAIASDGTLTASSGAVATGLAPTSMAIDSTGTWLLTVDASTGMVSVYQINASTGALATPAQVALDAGTPSQLYFTPNNGFVAVALQTGGVDMFTFDSATGALTNRLILHPLNLTQNADVAVKADPLSKFMYVAETGANGVRAFTIGSDGSLTQLTGSPFATGIGPAALATDSAGKFLYVANKSANNISGFSIGTTGTLTALTGSPFTAGTTPIAITLDQTGNFLGVVSSGGNPDLQLYSFDTTTAGKLDAVSHANTGTDPVNAVGVASAK